MNKNKKKDKREYSIQTVANAMRLLEEFRDAPELGVTELADRLALHKNNVFRLLATLEHFEYIEQNPETERYWLGVRAFELGQTYARSRDLLRRARLVVQGLARQVGETIHLGVERGLEVVHLDGEESGGLVRTALRVGRRLPLHCTALGKVLLGGADPAVREDFDRRIAADGLEERTPLTITNRDKLFEHLRTAAVRGFALDLEECEPGLSCGAAPVFDAAGKVVAALSVSAPSQRMQETRLLQEVVPQVMAAADRLSRELGYASGSPDA